MGHRQSSQLLDGDSGGPPKFVGPAQSFPRKFGELAAFVGQQFELLTSPFELRCLTFDLNILDVPVSTSQFGLQPSIQDSQRSVEPLVAQVSLHHDDIPVDAVAVGAGLKVQVREEGSSKVLGEGNRPGEASRPVTVDVDEHLGRRGSSVRREVVGPDPGEVVGHVCVLQPGQSTCPPAHPKTMKVVLDVLVPVAMDRVSGSGLDTEAERRSSLANPGEDILAFL